MEINVHKDAVDVLRDALVWRLTEGHWVAVGRAVDSLATALAAKDAEAFREAVYDLELAGPVRAVSAQTPPTDLAPVVVRERINELIHTLDGQVADDEPSSASS